MTTKIALLGQLVLHQNPVTISSEILDLLKSCDIVVANMDNAVSNPRNGTITRNFEKYSHVISDDVLDLCNKLNITVICLANNHIYDYGEEGILNTIDACNKRNINFVGLNNQFIKTINGNKIQILATYIVDSENEYNSNPRLDRLFYENEQHKNDIIKKFEKDTFTILHTHIHSFNNIQPLIYDFISNGVDCYFSTGIPQINDVTMYQVNNTKSLVCYNLGSFIFQTKIPEKYTSIAFESLLIVLEVRENKINNVEIYKTGPQLSHTNTENLKNSQNENITNIVIKKKIY